jgi:general secretion pathway protein H
VVQRGRQRGVTLIELLVAIALVALLAGGMVLGVGAIGNARLRESSTIVAAAVRAAYNHANATSRPTRVVFDFGERTVTIEEAEGKMFLESGDRTGGAAAATDAEREAVAASEEILEGTRAPRPDFKPVTKLLGFSSDLDESGVQKPVAQRSLSREIYFRSIEVAHDDEPATDERVYLYFWPGGQTESAAIQLQRGVETDVSESDIITVLVSPLTGKVQIVGGERSIERPTDDEEASEREDTL